MKISLAWVFDHIDADWKDQDIEHLIKKFNQVTAEVENYSTSAFDMEQFALGTIQKHSDQEITLYVQEWDTTISLNIRADAKNNMIFMVKKTEDGIRWAVCKDFGLEKVGNLPEFDLEKTELDGTWKNRFESEDVILEVDNKSITHRPDMWGHRGFAREIAAFLDLPLKKADNFLAKHKIDYINSTNISSKENKFVIEVQDQKKCSKFAGLYFKEVVPKASDIFIASRLLKVGSRSINMLVDISNYVMIDWSQPTHAYDAEKITKKSIIARSAQPNEKLVLLDGNEIELTEKDLIIADAEKPVALAGVMGGLHSSVNDKTKSIFLESAHFDAALVRRMAARHNSRTEASSRFEKTLDFNQAVDGILRFLKLANDFSVDFKIEGDIVCVGQYVKERDIDLKHSFLENRSGLKLSKKDVANTLINIGFMVKTKKYENDNLYTITIPSFRASKDIEIEEDILEEIVRFYGFEKFSMELPAFEKNPSDLKLKTRDRKIRNYLCQSVRMMEQRNYMMYDEPFMKEIGWEISSCATLANPVSQTNSKLVDSLLPNLFKNIKENLFQQDSLRFFEIARTWHSLDSEETFTEEKEAGNKPLYEKKRVAGIFFEKRKTIDFYECKELLDGIFDMIGMKASWKKITKNLKSWMNFNQAAKLEVSKDVVGFAGIVTKPLMNKLDALPESSAFAFELDADYLLTSESKEKHFLSFSKFQGATFDVSFLVPLKLTTTELEIDIKECDSLIEKVRLIDFFEKKEWTDQRSLAFRVWLQHFERTLTKDEIENVRQKVIQKLLDAGGAMRL